MSTRVKICVVVLACLVCLSLPNGQRTAAAPPAAAAQKPADEKVAESSLPTREESDPLKTATVRVTDADTSQPIRDFAYRYTFTTVANGGKRAWGEWQTVQDGDGVVRIDVPRSCLLRVQTKAKGYVEHWGGDTIERRFLVHSSDRRRQFQVALLRGVTVTGTVLDDDTGDPVSDARVHPSHFPSPVFRADPRTYVTTDDRGRFRYVGLHPYLGDFRSKRLQIVHPDYQPLYLEVRDLSPPEVTTSDVSGRLTPCPRRVVHGTVHDPHGETIAGVHVTDGWGLKQAKSDARGRFSLEVASDLALLLTKTDYHDKTEPVPDQADPLRVVLHPVLDRVGRVVSLEGQPISKFTVAYFKGDQGVRSDLPLVTKPFQSLTGHYRLRGEGRNQRPMVVRADGYAPHVKPPVYLVVGEEKIALDPGVAVSGMLRGSRIQEEETEVILVPWVPGPNIFGIYHTPFRDAKAHRTRPRPDGSFRLPHVASGAYALVVKGQRSDLAVRGIRVGKRDIGIGTLDVPGSGRIVGQVLKSTGRGKPEPHAFSTGTISYPLPSHQRSVDFLTDEDGRFFVDCVPAGEVQVVFFGLISKNVIDGTSRFAQVIEGRTTEVRFTGPPGQWNLPLQIVVGDGSEVQYRAGAALDANEELNVGLQAILEPTTGQPCSFPRENEFWPEGPANFRLTIPDVHPGKYQLRIRHPLGSDYYKREIDFAPGAPPLRITLSAGSIRGSISAEDIPSGYLRVKVSAMSDNDVWWVDSDEKDWSLPFVPPGTYSLFLHGDDGGWARVDDVVVDDKLCDVGRVELQRGGRIVGRLDVVDPGCNLNAVIATDQRGVSLRIPLGGFGRLEETFTFRGLWPGKWTVALQAKGTTLASKTVTVEGTKTVRCDFAVNNASSPR